MSGLDFDPAPLIAFARWRWRVANPNSTTPASFHGLGLLMRVTRETVSRWNSEGRMSITAAEKASDALGVDPSAIWPDYYERINAHYDKEGEPRGKNKSARSR